ncbi:hypothetical protein TL16_g03146 [Triparma laevis f. inornata]|uniref:Kinesin light chain n=1 Tax=Triparma laevis f. inornata TaxID=1714386 RepID=A0A9W6ZUX0_9STRA|nr:hypothetical protein TL16_g03146 [Triparma laevis f. inornata]
MEQQVLRITRSEDLLKLRALSKLCSREIFNDVLLLVVAWRRIMEVLELAIPEEKKVRGKKKKLKIFDACAALGRACGFVGDIDNARRYYERAKEGYEEQLGRDSEKALEVTLLLILATKMSKVKKVEKFRDLLKRCEGALGEENAVTLETLNGLGSRLQDSREYEEAKEVYERCLAGQMKVLGEDHKDTLGSLNNLGLVYSNLENYDKALLGYFERTFKAKEGLWGETHPETIMTVMNFATVNSRLNDYRRAEELYERALEGYEAQFEKDHERTMGCAKNFKICLEKSGNSDERLDELTSPTHR